MPNFQGYVLYLSETPIRFSNNGSVSNFPVKQRHIERMPVTDRYSGRQPIWRRIIHEGTLSSASSTLAVTTRGCRSLYSHCETWSISLWWWKVWYVSFKLFVILQTNDFKEGGGHWGQQTCGPLLRMLCLKLLPLLSSHLNETCYTWSL